ncbi:hypothetical protein PENSPDRAFT_299812 [Peniophora sp. CONT]|nr:hypothetical protein PENSPDRAFT_299812 [Peniophora sp. CONT]
MLRSARLILLVSFRAFQSAQDNADSICSGTVFLHHRRPRGHRSRHHRMHYHPGGALRGHRSYRQPEDVHCQASDQRSRAREVRCETLSFALPECYASLFLNR